MLPLVIALIGPTAAGKTQAALAIAHEWPVEIISMDSALVYRGMDIGTAKPCAAQRAFVPHHLIDMLDPKESYSACAFCQNANTCIDAIHARGKLPLLVGGTMLYFKALRDGLDTLPLANPTIRAMLNAQAAHLGWPAMHARLTQLDSVTAKRLAPNDSQRIQRALEIIQITGQPMSSLLTRSPIVTSTAHKKYTFLPIALEPSDRSILHTRIAKRFHRMLEASPSLITEVEALRTRTDLHANLPSMRCVGYRQTWAFLNGDINRDTLVSEGIAATRQLAKRQLTWLRSMPKRHVIDCLRPDIKEAVLNELKHLLPHHSHAIQSMNDVRPTRSCPSKY